MEQNENGGAASDQVTIERFHEARGIVSRIFELDVATVDTPALAEGLRGVSQAVDDIVSAKYTSEVWRPYDTPGRDLTDPTPGLLIKAIVAPLYNGASPGRSFSAYQSVGSGSTAIGASMEVCDSKQILCVLALPTDQQIDQVLAEDLEYCTIRDARARDYRDKHSGESYYPFCGSMFRDDAPAQYLRRASELCSLLLATTT
jgi:hypothetical protein